MNIICKGNFIHIKYDASDKPELSKFPDGYSFESITIVGEDNINVIYDQITFVLGVPMRFRPVNSKSPCVLHPIKRDATKPAYLRLLITKFGQIPDADYFNKTFKPILVTGEDGNEYPVIPSDQFK